MQRQFLKKSISSTLMATLLVTTSAGRASADLGDIIKGGAAAVIIGCATGALNCKGKRPESSNPPSKPKYQAPRMSEAERQQNRDVQSSLNAFGFPVGTVDGSLGKRSRSAISDYQGYMGYPRTGQLTDWERQALVNGWQKLNAGAGSAFPNTMAAVGPRGLLNIERDPNYPTQFGDNALGANDQANRWGNNQFGGSNQGGSWDQAGIAPNPQPIQPIQPLPKAVPEGGGQIIEELPALKPIGKPVISAAARCELVAQTTRIQGGVVQAVNMTDSDQALSEKFCEARGFAITQGGSVASQFQVSENELNSLCEQIQTGYAGVVANLPSAPQEQVLTAAQTATAELGMTDPATTAAYGQICMGIGYRLDNAEMALSGALAMISAGQTPYGEMVGHHLREGFGVSQTPGAAVPWYSGAMTSLEQGATPAFVPSTTSERIQVIRAALQLDEQRASNMGQGVPKLIKTSNELSAPVVTNP